MTLEDPFYVVKDEVFKALNKTRGLYLRWQEISVSPATANSPEVEWTSTELRNALRSIEWDLEDLDDTILSSIVERNSSKFKIDNKEICDRRGFIEATKQEVEGMRGGMALGRRAGGAGADGAAREPLLPPASPPPHFAAWKSTPNYTKYSKLANQPDSPTRGVYRAGEGEEEGGAGDEVEGAAAARLLARQDAALAALGRSASALRAVGGSVAQELDDHAVMLDELGTELEESQSKLESAAKRAARVLHVHSDRRQWAAIGALVALLLLILILFIVL